MPHVENNKVGHARIDVDYRVESKRTAQQMNIDVWRSIVGRKKFWVDEQYWTLMDAKSFELETVENNGLLQSRSQFHGVNNIHENFEACVQNFPGIITHEGDWLDIMDRTPACPKGGIAYLDTMAQLDDISAEASTLLAVTLQACGAGTLVCANFCFDNPYRGRKKIPFNTFVERIKTFIPDAIQSKWALVNCHGNGCYLPDKTSSTQMVTFFFWRAK